MQVKVKKQNKDGIVRLESSGDIKEILINENFIDPDNESISLCFRGKDSSGIIDLTPDEMNKVIDAVQKRMHLIKSSKIIK